MKTMQWRTCALAALLPLSALVQAAPADPTDAMVGVPAASYDSAFKTYQPAVNESATPDKAWRAANDAVAAKPGDDHMMGMQMGGSMTMPNQGRTEGSSNGTMVMPDGTTMLMSAHDHKHSNEGMKIPVSSTTSVDKGMKIPMPKREVAKPKQKSVAMPMDKNMKMPMPKGDASMPGMDMSRDQSRKGH